MDAPFLPEPEPQQTPPQSSGQGMKTLALWLVLIILFLVIWQFLGPGPEQGAPATPEAPKETTSFGWLSFLPLVVVVVLLAFFFRTYRVAVGFNVAQEPARRASAERRFADAAKSYVEVAERYRKQPLYALAARYAAAVSTLASGDLHQARTLFADIERNKTFLFTSSVRLQAAIQLAAVNALLGETDVGERWAAEARRRLAKTEEDRLSAAALLCWAEAMLLVRRGKSKEGVALLEKNWMSLREVLSANQLRVVEVVRAFAESAGGPREYGPVGDRLVRIEPVTPGEFAFLGACWPEMRSFLEAHRLG
jgi:hypothetical protein